MKLLRIPVLQALRAARDVRDPVTALDRPAAPRCQCRPGHCQKADASRCLDWTKRGAKC